MRWILVCAAGIVNHNALKGCQRCTVTGQRVNNRTCFPRFDCSKMTNMEFRSKSFSGHHRETSILEQLPINMIDDFVIAEDLHLFHLGIMKKCIEFWKDGKSNLDYKWSDDDIADLNRMLNRINCDMPIEIHRSIRNIDCFKFWKGTEFRTFLLYVGIVVLKHCLRESEYIHFRKLFCAVTLCTTDKYMNKNKDKTSNLISILFNEYVEEFINLYGIEYVNSNVHNLIHVKDDILRFGNLTKISAYRFENCLAGLKLRIRTCNRPLEQISRRLSELDFDYHPINVEQTFEPILRYPISIDENECAYNQIILGNDLVLNSRSFGDKWVLFDSGKVAEFHFCLKRNGKCFLYASCIENLNNFFTQPFSSKKIYIFSGIYNLSAPAYYEFENIMAKMVCIRNSEEEFIFIPLLHTLK